MDKNVVKYCLCANWVRFFGGCGVADDDVNFCPFCGKKTLEEKQK